MWLRWWVIDYRDSEIVSIEVNNLLQIELEQRRSIIVHEPQHVLEQNVIHIDKDYSSLRRREMEVLLLRRRVLLHGYIHQNAKGALLQYERLHHKHPLLFSDHHRHALLRFFLQQPLFRKRHVTQTRTSGTTPDQWNRHHQTIHGCSRSKVRCSSWKRKEEEEEDDEESGWYLLWL